MAAAVSYPIGPADTRHQKRVTTSICRGQKSNHEACQMYLYTHTHTHTYIYIYIYIVIISMRKIDLDGNSSWFVSSCLLKSFAGCILFGVAAGMQMRWNSDCLDGGRGVRQPFRLNPVAEPLLASLCQLETIWTLSNSAVTWNSKWMAVLPASPRAPVSWLHDYHFQIDR